MAQEKNNNSGSVGCGLLGVLQIIFIVMKLTAPESTIYKWSWIEVLIPLWISLGCCSCLCICLSCGGCAYFASTLFGCDPNDKENNKTNKNNKIVVKTPPKRKQFIIENKEIDIHQLDITIGETPIVDENLYETNNNV